MENTVSMATVYALSQDKKTGIGFRQIIIWLIASAVQLSAPVERLARILGLVEPYDLNGVVDVQLFFSLVKEATPVIRVLNGEGVSPAEVLLNAFGMDYIPLSYALDVLGADLGVFVPECRNREWRFVDPNSDDILEIPMSNRARSFLINSSILTRSDSYQNWGKTENFPADVQEELSSVLAHWDTPLSELTRALSN